MPLLAFETSCDETSAAVVHAGRVLSNPVSSQTQLHLEYGGVVPELAAREHLRNLPLIAREALLQANIGIASIEAVAATQGPGLPGALMTGLKAAQAVAYALRKPFYGIHHHEAHLYSPWIQGDPPVAEFEKFQPNVSLIVSGGHTMLVHVHAEMRHTLLGSTVDDAAGECFDKAGKLMGLPYPAGPEIDRLAADGDPSTFDFPRPMLRDSSDDFSFSGLKTSVKYRLRDEPMLTRDPGMLRDLCASVQAAIIDVLVAKTIQAVRRLGLRCVTASGGVTCNRSLRSALASACTKHHLDLRVAERSLCTDNAAMIGILAERKWKAGMTSSDLDTDIRPSWPLEAAAAS